MTKIDLNSSLSYLKSNKDFKVGSLGRVKIKIGDDYYVSRRKFAKLILKNGSENQKCELKQVFEGLKLRINERLKEKGKHALRIHRFFSWLGRLSYNYEKKLEELRSPKPSEEFPNASSSPQEEVVGFGMFSTTREPESLEGNEFWKEWNLSGNVEALIKCATLLRPIPEVVRDALCGEGFDKLVQENNAELLDRLLFIIGSERSEMFEDKLKGIRQYSNGDKALEALENGAPEEKWKVILAVELASFSTWNLEGLVNLPRYLLLLWDKLETEDDRKRCEAILMRSCERLVKNDNLQPLQRALEYADFDHPALIGPKERGILDRFALLKRLANHCLNKDVGIICAAINEAKLKGEEPLDTWYVAGYKLGDSSMLDQLELKHCPNDLEAIEEPYKLYLKAKLEKSEDLLKQAATMGHKVAQIIEADPECKMIFFS